ncbi:MAG: tetratricopeptide repeat protein [Pirellulales bacterium]|nr:tetratricopeptide repeat protein [Pirellulales bacterium]
MPGTQGTIADRLSQCRKLSQQGLSAIDARRWDEAEQLMSKAIKTCPDDLTAKRYYAEALWNRGKQAAAIEQLEIVVERSADGSLENVLDNSDGEIGPRVRLVEMLLAVDRLKEARRHAEAAIDMAPNVGSAWAARAQVLARMGLFEEARADYQRALAYMPEDRSVLLGMAEVYRELNKPQEALAVLNRLSDTYSLDSVPKEVIHLQGLALAAQGRFSAAAESYERIIALEGATADNYFDLADAHWQAGCHDKAVQAARQALLLDPLHGRSHKLLERMQAGMKNRFDGFVR